MHVPVFRILAAFDGDPHRSCVMHKTRARLLLPLDGALSYQHYPGLVRSISLELGNIYREVHEIKESAGWPAAKVRGERMGQGGCWLQQRVTLIYEHIVGAYHRFMCARIAHIQGSEGEQCLPVEALVVCQWVHVLLCKWGSFCYLKAT